MKKLLILFAIFTFGLLSFAGTTGGLVGKVIAEDGTGLPGVTIIAKSPALQGQKSTTTDANGKFRLILLPPGVYEVTFSMSSFQTITRKNVRVLLDNTLTLNQMLKPDKLEESIVVTAEQPLIDSTSTTVGQNYSTDYVESIPTGRSYTTIMNLTPGVTGSDGISTGNVVAGASGTESTYIIDGMTTTDLENGIDGKGLNFDFVEEIQVKTGGYEAEFGQSMGAVVNVITKSGGNDFSGSAFYYWRNPSYSAKNTETYLGSTYIGTKEYDYGFSLGGPIVKDKLWFFIAYNPSVREDVYSVESIYRDWNHDGVTQSSEYTRYDQIRGENEVTRKTERDYWALKLSYNINENNTIIFSAFGDPTDYTFKDATGPTTRDTISKLGGTDFTVKYDGILTENLVVSAQYGHHFQQTKDRSLDGNNLPRTFMAFDSAAGDKGGAGYMENTEKERNEYKFSLEYFLGNHDIKAGILYQENIFDSGRRYSGGHYNQVFDYNGLIGYVDEGEVWIKRRDMVFNDPNGELSYGGFNFTINDDFLQTETETDNTAFYIQDKWNVMDNFMLSFGFRHAEQEVKGNNIVMGGTYTALKIDDMDSPRIGFTYDIFNDGTSKLYGSWGRFYESIPLDINNRQFGEEIFYQRYYYVSIPDVDTNGDGYVTFMDLDPEAIAAENDPYKTNVSGLYVSPVGDGLKGSSHDEFILGYDQLINDLWSVGVKFTYKQLNDVIEDISFDGGTNYIIANPGRTLNFTAEFEMDWIDRLGNARHYDTGDYVTVTPEEMGFTKPKRNYRAYELLLKRKFADNWQMNFSYIFSKTWGDYTGGVNVGNYFQVDPNITAQYDLPYTVYNTGGVLPFDRPHQVKIDGVYSFDSGINVGFQYTYYSGTPLTAYADMDSAGWYGNFQWLQSGAVGRTDARQSFDFNISYTQDLGKYGKLTGYFYIFNLFNFQAVTGRSELLLADLSPLYEAGGLIDTDFGGDEFAFFEALNGKFANLSELEQFMDQYGLERDPHWMEPTSYQSPRYIRFGVKYKF